MNVLNLIKIIPYWGMTSGDVLTGAQTIVFEANTPPPFETECTPVNLYNILTRMKEVCDQATTSRRKGMMISSRFTVKIEERSGYGNVVSVYHVRNTKPPRLFFFLHTL